MISNGAWTFVEFGNGKIREVLRVSMNARDAGRSTVYQVYHDYDISDPENPVFVSISGEYCHGSHEKWGFDKGVQYSKENPSPDITDAAKEELKKGYMMSRYKQVKTSYKPSNIPYLPSFRF